MKLIDAEALKDDGSNYVWSQFADGSFIKKEMKFVNREQIDNAPTVEAIPIEWLEKWFTEKHKRAIIWWDCAEGVFKAFMEDWRKENEID